MCLGASTAEKAIKALLVARDVDPPKLHDLDRLVQRLPERLHARFLAFDLPDLTRWAIDGRYPGDLDEATSADAERAISMARDLLAAVRSELRGALGDVDG